MNDIAVLGFTWDRTRIPTDIPVFSVERTCFRFHRMLPEFVWDAGVLEGNPFTFPEVKTLLDGITSGGRRLTDQHQILDLAESSKHLLALVKSGEFDLTKAVFCNLNAIVARHEALECVGFRGEGKYIDTNVSVSLGEHGTYHPAPTEAGGHGLNRLFVSGVKALGREISNPFERALAFYLFGALQQFFFDRNKRTSRFMMNGMLMSNGIDAISVPAARAQEFNDEMVGFYRTKEASRMMSFLTSCHPSQGNV